MSVITLVKVQEKDKRRCNVFVDGEFSFSLSVDLVIKYGIKKDANLNDFPLEDIKKEDNKNYAFSLALKYLSRALKTKKQVVTYLLNKGFDQDVVFSVIDKLKEYNYVNDEEYARRYLELKSSSEGKRLSDYKLMIKGLKKSDIDNARDSIEINSKENAFYLAQKKIKNKEINTENLSKVYRYLIGKGFSYEDANFAISSLKENVDD